MPIPAIVGALGPPVLTGLAGILAGRGQADANRRNRQLVREQMAFQERMSGTSYQRAMADMRMAGLNPMLAYQQGGASTPGGATAKMESTLGPAVSSAVAVRRMSAEIRAITAGVEKTKAETDAIRGRPGRILEPAVDRGVELARELFGSTISSRIDRPLGRTMTGTGPTDLPSIRQLISATSARAVQGFKNVAATILRGFGAPRRRK